MKICGIYKITNTINNKIYIGQSIDIERRWKDEKRDGINEHLKKSINKYGIEFFKFEILYKCHRTLLNDCEEYWISYFNTTNPKYGYNKTYGGSEGSFPSEETRKKISESNKGKPKSEEHKQKISETLKGNTIRVGMKNTDETNKKISDSLIGKMVGEKNPNYGKDFSEETRKKMSDAKKGKQLRLGIKHTEESKQKMSETRRKNRRLK